jgi:cell division protein FtsA
MSDSNIVVGIDLGTTKICVVIAELLAGEGVKVVGIGHSPSEGLRRGVVVDVDKTVQSLTTAVQQAELVAGIEIGHAYAGIAGEHIGSLDSEGAIAIGGQEITALDRERAIAAARIVAIPFDREVLHVMPQEFRVDDQGGIRNPVGMFGVRLGTTVHIVTGAVTSVQNICKSIQRAGIDVTDIVLEPLASSCAVLRDEDREMGVCLIDIGGGTTDMALFFEGSVRETSVIAVGGQNVTSDVAICLRTAWSHAESLKCDFGAALEEIVDGTEMVEVPRIINKTPESVPRTQLAAIIEARMEEIFSMVGSKIDAGNYADQLGAGIVLTGGGAMLPGSVELAERIFQMPVRLGRPQGFSGLGDQVTSPLFSTVMGLVRIAADNGEGPVDSAGRQQVRGLSDGRFEAVAGRMREWFQALL